METPAEVVVLADVRSSRNAVRSLEKTAVEAERLSAPHQECSVHLFPVGKSSRPKKP